MNRAVLLEPQHIHPARGVAGMKKKSKKQEVLDLINGGLNIVLTIETPSGPVHFADNAYRNKSKEELEAIKEQFYATCWQVIKNNS